MLVVSSILRISMQLIFFLGWGNFFGKGEIGKLGEWRIFVEMGSLEVCGRLGVLERLGSLEVGNGVWSSGMKFV